MARDAVDAGGAKGESADLRTAKSCGPDASTPASSLAECIFQEMTVTRKPDHRPITGEITKETVKTTARGMPGEPA
jgi:hypothetical protein